MTADGPYDSRRFCSRLQGMTRNSRKAKTGAPAPAIDLAQADGSRWKLADATKDGPVVLVFLRGFF